MPQIGRWRATLPTATLAVAMNACWLGACRSTSDSRARDPAAIPPARINHVVLFTLQDPSEADALIADSRRSLGAIPGVASMFCGKHADAGRPGIMTDYDACVYVGFDSLEDYSAYVADARHQALVARWRERLEGYRVYDVLDESAR